MGQLGEAGWVERALDPADRRVARLRLTRSAAQRLTAYRDEREAILTDALEQLSARERCALVDALAPLARLAEELHG